ncbi:hypothetical protein ABT143_06325 [Streptomyces sp. NPDC002033]|uniref:hypothetical protein n=1 Tax=unclassified Streptomyces TaxID=2593676 RepID=UPI003330434B
MSENTPNAKGTAPAQYKPAATGLAATNHDDALRRIDAQAAELAKSLEELKDAPEATRAAAVRAVKPRVEGYLTNWSQYERGHSVLIPADQVKTEDIGTLSIEYLDGQPLIAVSGGKYISAALTVVDGAGNAVAGYAAGPRVPTDAVYSFLEIKQDASGL